MEKKVRELVYNILMRVNKEEGKRKIKGRRAKEKERKGERGI